ncbi:hypothetical protein B0F90DRAFT_1824487 [Multifurca ochricompacta]|uniref:Uncharacterized protein n=1 Tax=Multifurca ochricompacta TaxID=376703 RepID=A0AAD4QES5_9AGAM|nr:hypothetical protein B0F90DRAFT_1824487 [Multifurca ochricompacta]
MLTPKTLATNISADNETRIWRIATALDAANKTAITFPATAPTLPPTPALPNEDLIVTRSWNALANTFLPTPRPCQSTTDRHRSNEGRTLHARFVSFNYRQCNPQVLATMSENQPLFAIALHARNHSRTPRHPNPPISRFQQQLFDMEMPHTELVNTALDDLRNLRIWAKATRFHTTTNDLDKAHRYLAMAKNSFRPPRQESPTRPTTLYTEWINTVLDDLRDPGVWAEVTRFRTTTNDLDVAQQAMAAARKQIE